MVQSIGGVLLHQKKELVLFDGNPFHPGPDALWKMADEEKITVFGTSAGYIEALKNAGVKPKEIADLSALKSVLSTGSPLSNENFHFIYDHVKTDVQLASISGGSDLNGCFALATQWARYMKGNASAGL